MDDWAPFQTADGCLYFLNQSTGQASWERPQQQRHFSQNQTQPRRPSDSNNQQTFSRESGFRRGQILNNNTANHNNWDYNNNSTVDFTQQNFAQVRDFQMQQNFVEQRQSQNENFPNQPQGELNMAKNGLNEHYNSQLKDDNGKNDQDGLLNYIEGFRRNKNSEVSQQRSSARRPPPGLNGQNSQPSRAPPGFQKQNSQNNSSNMRQRGSGNNQKQVKFSSQRQQRQQQQRQQQHRQQRQQHSKKTFNIGEIVLATYIHDGKQYKAKITGVLRDGCLINWIDFNEQTKVKFSDIVQITPTNLDDEKTSSPAQSYQPPRNQTWGAVRRIRELNKWQTRTPDGNVLPQLFDSHQEATLFLRDLQEQAEKKKSAQVRQILHKQKKEYKTKPQRDDVKESEQWNRKSQRMPSPPAYIPPMPADMYSDDDDDEEEEEVKLCEVERPIGREIICDSGNDMERLVVTSSVEMESAYSEGFEEWKPSQPWAHDDVGARIEVRDEFRKQLYRTAIFTASGMVYTELTTNPSDKELVVDGIIFTKHTRSMDNSKFLIRLQHALEHQLALALHRANFTRVSGETTPMYVFMSQSSGKEIKLQGGKEIINYCGIVPHVKVRSHDEIHLEMVPSEKSFLKRTLRDLTTGGKQKSYFKDTRGLVKTQNKLLTLTVVSILNELSSETTDPTTGLTVRQMATKRGMTLSYGDAVVVETTHGLFSSDEIHPSARLTKKEQASRDKQLGKHKYNDRQQCNFKIVDNFKSELCESIKRHCVGLRVMDTFIVAPCTYLPEVQIRRASSTNAAESIGSKSRHHEWDRLLKKVPANFRMRNFVVIIDRSFSRDKGTLHKLFRSVIKRRPWIPEPNIIITDLNEMTKIWTNRQTNVVRYLAERNVDQRSIQNYFKQFALISKITNTEITFRNDARVPEILNQGEHKINGVKVKVECSLKMSRHAHKQCGDALIGIREADGLLIFLPGKEGSSRVTHMKNKLTMMINGEEGFNPCALQFVMQCHIRKDSRKSFAILQEALEAGLVPKTGAITFEIDQSRCDFDLVIAIDVSQERADHKVASIVATNSPFEGSIKAMTSVVSLVDARGMKGDVIPYDQMTLLLQEIGLTGSNILIYRHNCSVEYKEIFYNEIQGALDHFTDSHITFIEVTSTSSLRILDVPFSHLGNRQAKGEFIITKKITQTWKKALEFHIRHIEKSNPVKYSIIYSTNRSLLTSDSEVLNVASFTHNLTKNYVHHKDGSKLPGPLKYADHIARLYASIMKSMAGKSLPRFNSRALRPRVV